MAASSALRTRAGASRPKVPPVPCAGLFRTCFVILGTKIAHLGFQGLTPRPDADRPWLGNDAGPGLPQGRLAAADRIHSAAGAERSRLGMPARRQQARPAAELADALFARLRTAPPPLRGNARRHASTSYMPRRAECGTCTAGRPRRKAKVTRPVSPASFRSSAPAHPLPRLV